VERYLGHCVDGRLSVIPAKTLDHCYLGFVQEDVCDQGDRSAHDERTVDQMFPCWKATVHKKLVELMTYGPE